MDYFLAGNRPISIKWEESTPIIVNKYDWATGHLINGNEYVKHIYFGRGEIFSITEEEFNKKIEILSTNLIDIDSKAKTLIEQYKRIKHAPNLKNPNRTIEKAIEDYGGDVSGVLDISSSMINYDSVEQIYSALDKISTEYNVLRILDRFQKPLPSGYKDILLNLQMSNGHIAEMRLGLKSISNLSEWHNGLNKKVNNIIDLSIRRKRNLKKRESRKIFDLWKALTREYKTALLT